MSGIGPATYRATALCTSVPPAQMGWGPQHPVLRDPGPARLGQLGKNFYVPGIAIAPFLKAFSARPEME